MTWDLCYNLTDLNQVGMTAGQNIANSHSLCVGFGWTFWEPIEHCVVNLLSSKEMTFCVVVFLNVSVTWTVQLELVAAYIGIN